MGSTTSSMVAKPLSKLARRAMVTATALALALGYLAFAGPIPGAEAATSNCSAGRACVWRDSSYKSGSYQNPWSFSSYSNYFSDYTWPGTGGYVDDSATSLYNHGNYDAIKIYTAEKKKGYVVQLSKGTAKPDLRNFGISGTNMNWNDKISSACFISYC
jgi:hypothetical protein